MKAKKFLCVDGDFFCHRAIHGMRILNKDITLDSNEEMNNFNKYLINSLHTLYNTFINEHHELINQIIFVFDNKSWRKNLTPVKPYFLENDNITPINYKENRVSMKKESDINYDNFAFCKREFIETLEKSEIIPVFNFDGAEGDDLLIMLKTQLLINNPDNKMIVFCTDGDLKQLLYKEDTINQKPDSVILYRNIRSNSAPEGEFVISDELFESLYGKRDEFGREDIMDAFLRASNDEIDSNYFKNILFKINFKDNSGKASFNREPGNGISIATPTLTLLSKIILGDKKDNVFPIFRWKTKTGNSFRNVNETHLINIFNELNYKFNDNSALLIYNDKLLLTKLLYSLREEVKQNEIDIQLIGKHFSHNRKILDIRNINYIPEDVINKFIHIFNNLYDKKLFETNLTKELISKIKTDYSDSTNILSKSLPDLPDELKVFKDLL